MNTDNVIAVARQLGKTNGMLGWWRMYQRAFDMKHLWPAMLAEAEAQGMTRFHASAMFASHCNQDPVWTTDYCEEAIVWMGLGLARSE